MPELTSFKMPFQTRHFNKNQRVWVIMTTGALAAFCAGKFRGRGRYVKAWVRWDSKAKITPEFQAFDVAQEFATKLLSQ